MRLFSTAITGSAMLPLAAALSMAVAWQAPAFAQPKASNSLNLAADSAANHSRSTINKVHRVVIQVSQNDPAVMNLALNNGDNLAKFYRSKGEHVEIEFVAFGAGLNMVRNDTSPVKDRLAEMSHMKEVTFSGCANTLLGQSKQEKKTISLVPEARLVPTGVARIVELEEEGWTYLRP
jgi:uncharacterized protein